MAVKFEIQQIITSSSKKPKPYLLVKLLNQNDKFWITNHSRLNNIELIKELRQPRAADENNNPRFDLYALTPSNRSDIENFNLGDIVELKPGNAIEFLQPWYRIEESNRSKALENELRKELSPEHQLFNNELKAIAKREDTDDVLFQFDNSERYAVVHLTWKNKNEKNHNYPRTEIFEHWTDLYENRILFDYREYND
ncbi:hypothetical protein [Aureibacter tunicatorum]|uniref:Uncharacterized protein n=1 Tax=Aureibacter tunicatorum TaxID=866807 RepID=A0AAE3XSE3_9BACT|nr:hypothetical protein [Aureibacter tunicatorum]MDR6241125.1 hypothetical protein [Aureibacter tunicatorum]BDD03903.1 hypothetical protein AUTU_13860 [Aureibacter tunicatorum]